MTPISATGSPDRAEYARVSTRQARSGFTLVELLVTIAVIGVAAGAVVLSMPDSRPSVAQDAEQFAARLVRAREEAVLGNHPVAVDVGPDGYAFSVFDGDEWTPTPRPLQGRAWEEGLNGPRVSLRLTFDPTGVTDPADIVLSRDGRSRTVRVDGAGEVSIND